MPNIIFGRLKIPKRSYAYHLGYTAGYTGHLSDLNPYTHPDQAQQAADFRHGYAQGRKDTSVRLDEVVERIEKRSTLCLTRPASRTS